NLKNGTWRSLGECQHLAIEGSASVFRDNQWLIFGGKTKAEKHGEPLIIDSVFAFDPITGDWKQKSALPLPLTGHRVFPSREGIYVIGGKSNFGTSSNACFLYRTEENNWQEIGELSVGRSLFGLLPVEGKEQSRLYAIGGFIRDDLPATEIDGCTLNQNLFVYR
ncbi:MAG: hypothetical protein MI743_02975, partial [Sneathiellales bacterium]|nr:hypothetical protein [Sneathiellales bacterium]